MNERPAPLPILGSGLSVDYQRVGLGPLQDRIAPPGQMVGRFGIGERESVCGVEMILVLLAARNDCIRKTMVQPFAPGARHVRQDAIEHLASGSVGVEPAIDEIADATPGLRPTPGVGLFDRAEAGAALGCIS